MAELLILLGFLVAVFVGYNIGGSSTGVAFGPAVGSRIVRKVTAGALFTVFAFVGAWTIGRNVITTMSNQIVDAAVFTPAASVGVLFFTGFALLRSNLYGVPASTSMTAVGAIVGLGLATGTLNAALMFTILSAWIVAPLTALFAGAVIGRYLYPYLNAKLAFGRLTDPLIAIDTQGMLPRLSVNENVGSRDLVGSVLVVAIACYMGFSAGASNAANAVAPLVGNGAIDPAQQFSWRSERSASAGSRLPGGRWRPLAMTSLICRFWQRSSSRPWVRRSSRSFRGSVFLPVSR